MNYPTKKQISDLFSYINNNGKLSIYGMDGIYEELENRICDIYKSKYCLLTNTGTSALSSAYFSLGLKKGDEVIVPIYTFIATITPLFRLGCVPVFADAKAENGSLNLDSLQKLVTKKTKALAITHMWGVPCDMKEIMRFCKKNNLKLVEDCSHVHLTKYNNKLLGTYGDVSCFSVGAKKVLSGGEGGFLITNDPEIYIKATFLGHFKMRAKEALNHVPKKIADKYKDLTSGFGENYRMHPYSAVMINSLLKNELETIIEKRYIIYSYFKEKLDEIEKINMHDISKGAIYGFKPKLLDFNLDEFIKLVKEEGLKVKKLDTVPLYDDMVFKDCKFPLSYNGAKNYIDGRFSIPDFTTGNIKEDKKVVDKYIKIFKKIL